MNPSPRLHGQFITPATNHRLSLCNSEDAFWQSRMTLAGRRAELPNLVSLHDLARKIRAAAPKTWTHSPALYMQCIGRAKRPVGKVTIIYRDAEWWADVAAHAIPGIAARALTPTGSFDTAMDRSDVATAPVAGRRIHQNGGHRFIESACRYAEAKAAGVISESEARALTRADAGFPTNPV